MPEGLGVGGWKTNEGQKQTAVELQNVLTLELRSWDLISVDF